MAQIDEACYEKTKIDRVRITSDKLTSRAGLTFLVHYLKQSVSIVYWSAISVQSGDRLRAYRSRKQSSS